ncbi:hypothetical protein [Clostridium cadaveris]|uniref:hypothetical protein n=1 Tax=Clostridium cadaveris TaxID=1529 RepID=UPI0039939D71
MEKYLVLEHSLYHVDREKNDIELDNLEKGKAEEYVYSIIQKSLYAENVRLFKPKSETKEAIALINEFIRNYIQGDKIGVAATLEDQNCKKKQINDIASKIAYRLLDAEQKAQERIARLNKEIKKGSLIQAVIKDEEENEFCYILAKVEHINILDKKDWEQHTGLPLEKEILKTCVILYNEDGSILEIKIFDTNNTIADYWWNELLELEPITSNEKNTQDSYKEINKLLRNNIKEKSPADYTLMSNSLIGYYNQNPSFDFDELVEKVFKNYNPIRKDDINLEAFIEKLNKLPENKFDKRFDITPNVIRKRKERTYNISDEIDLTLKDSVENLADVIKSEKISDDEMYIRIKVDEKTFADFNYNK